jgi:signal transduction histidine kinase
MRSFQIRYYRAQDSWRFALYRPVDWHQIAAEMGLRARLLLLSLVPTVPALLLALYSNLEQRRLGTLKVEKDAMRIVQLAAAGQNGLVEATRRQLAGLARLPQALGHDLPAFDRFFADLRRVFTDYTDFGLIETNGALISSSFGHVEQTNHSPRTYLQRVLKSQDLAVGDFEPGDGKHSPGLGFGYPVLGPNKEVARVLYGTLDLRALDQALAKTPVPEGGVLEVLDHSGNVLARHPEGEKWVGQSIANTSLFAGIRAKEEGTAKLKGLDGQDRLYAFMPLRHGADINLFVTVGTPTTQAYAETHRILVRDLIILGTVAVLAFFAARFYADHYVLRPIKALAEATRRLASGDLSARAEAPRASGELHQLAQAFDHMAASLQQHRTEMEQTQAALQESEQRVRQLNATLETRVAERTEQLEAVNKELEAFCYSVSHDLRAPVRHIGGFVNLLGKSVGHNLSTEEQRYVAIISDSAKRMGMLIDDLLVFSRMGRVEMRQATLNLSSIVDETIEKLEPETQGRQIIWKKNPMPEVRADPAMLRQVFINLLANAVKYTRPRNPAEIEIGAVPENSNEVVVFVRDNGVGFDMQYVGKLFGVFQRLHLDEEFEGTGIGLANVRQIIARHGGRTWAEGKVGQGAAFYFSLPKADHAPQNDSG